MMLLRRYGLHMSLGSVHRYMSILDIRSIRKRVFRPQRKEAQTLHHTFPNVLKQRFSASSPNQIWLTDITYLPCRDGMLYLSCVKDIYDKSIIAYNVSNRNDTRLVIDTLRQCLEFSRGDTILHSDQGHQYTSMEYGAFIAENNIIGSMSRKATPYDNAPMESFFSIMKNEELPLHDPFPTMAHMRIVVADFILFYNTLRPQIALNRLTPFEFRHQPFS